LDELAKIKGSQLGMRVISKTIIVERGRNGQIAKYNVIKERTNDWVEKWEGKGAKLSKVALVGIWLCLLDYPRGQKYW
jgi:hypothetical protein